MRRRVAGIGLGLFAVGMAAPVWAAASEPPVAVQETPDAAARRILKAKEFAFCGSAEDTLAPGELAWCGVADKSQWCPQWQAMCRRATDLDVQRVRDSGSQAARRLQEGAVGVAGDRPEVARPMAKFAFDAVVFASIAVVGLLAARWLALRWRKDQAPPQAAPTPVAPAAHLAAQPEALGEVQALLAQARAAADRDPGQAHALLYAAALRHLELQGLLRWQRATSNREYLRAIRDRTPLHAPLAELVREVERQRFGRQAPSRARFEQLWTRVAPLLGVLLLALGCSGVGDSTLSGRAATWEVLRSQGVAVSSFSLSLADLDAKSPPLFVDADELRLDGPLMAALDGSVRRGAHVLIAAGQNQDLTAWLPLAVTDVAYEDAILPAPGFLARSGLSGVQTWLPGRRALLARPVQGARGPAQAEEAPAEPGAATDSTAGPDAPVAAEPEPAALPAPATVDAGEDLLLRGGHGFARLWHLGRGTVVVVADERLFANGAMALPGGAALASAVVFAAIGGRRQLAVARVGLAEPASSPTDSLQKAGLWPLTVQTALALLLWFLARGVAFGVLRDRDVKPRRAFAEHVRALGQHLRQRRASRLAASLYAGWALDRLWQRHGRRGSVRNVAALARDVAQRLSRREADIADCLQRADEVRSLPDAEAQPAEDLALMRELSALLVDRAPHRPPRPGPP